MSKKFLKGNYKHQANILLRAIPQKYAHPPFVHSLTLVTVYYCFFSSAY